MSHISLVEIIEGQTSCFLLLRVDLLLTLSYRKAAFSLPLVCSFYWEESIVSLSSKFQFSGFRMSPVDPLSDQVLSGVWLGWLCSYLLCSSINFFHLNGSSLEARVLSPKSKFLNQLLIF